MKGVVVTSFDDLSRNFHRQSQRSCQKGRQESQLVRLGLEWNSARCNVTEVSVSGWKSNEVPPGLTSLVDWVRKYFQCNMCLRVAKSERLVTVLPKCRSTERDFLQIKGFMHSPLRAHRHWRPDSTICSSYCGHSGKSIKLNINLHPVLNIKE